MDRLPSFRKLLEGLVADGLVQDDLNHLLAVENLLEAANREQWTRNQVAAAIASLYANTPDAWNRVDRAIRHALGDPNALPPVGTLAERPPTAKPTDVYLSIGAAKSESLLARLRRYSRSALERTLQRMARMSAASWTALLALGLLTSAVAGTLAIEEGSELIEKTLTPQQVSDTHPEPTPNASIPETPEQKPEQEPEPVNKVTFRSDGSTRLEIPKQSFDLAKRLPGLEGTTTGGLMSALYFITLVAVQYLSILGIFILAIAITSLGFTWLSTPRAFRAHVRKRRTDAKVLREQSAEALGSQTAPYLVDLFEPFGITNSSAHIDDLATILGRIGCEVPGETLDVSQTLDSTVRAGGIPTPVLQSSHSPRDLLILVDIEEGDHPYLHAVEWILQRWRRGGLGFVRFNFANRPDIGLEQWTRDKNFGCTQGQPTDLDAVARRFEGLPLLIFSRGTDLVLELRGADPVEASWLAFAGVWPKRLYIDLDPLPLPKRVDAVVHDKRSTLETLQAHGFMCVPFSLAGLEAGAMYLAGRDAAHPEYEPVRPLAEVREPIESWLAAVAVVPDPTWVQMEAFRREFFAEELPDPRYLQRALEWVHDAFAERGIIADGTKDNGQRLALNEFADDLLVRQIRRDFARPESESLLVRARKLLLRQLRGAAPAKDDPAYKMWSLKVAYQEAMLAPARANELLAPFLGTEVEDELFEMVAGAEDRETQLRDSGELAQPLAAEVHSWSLDGNRVPMVWFTPWTSVRRSRTSWATWVAGTGVVICSSVVAAFLLWPGVDDNGPLVGFVPADIEVQPPDNARLSDNNGTKPSDTPEGGCDFSRPPVFPPEPNPDIHAPPTGRSCGVIETALAGTKAPMNLIGLSGGEFTMGSPKAGGLDKHRVALSRFAICETEVSVGQYELVTGEKPPLCLYGCEGYHPVQLSWYKSVQFLNALTLYENKTRAKSDKLTECYDEKTWSWDTSCTGYRLPTEAEWEYAARAGSTTSYFFGDDANEVCRYANILDFSSSIEDDEAALCNDNFANFAPVKTVALRANPWGLHGIAGNVWEWVYDADEMQDLFDELFGFVDTGNAAEKIDFYKSPEARRNPVKLGSDRRVLRGGSFIDGPLAVQSAGRLMYHPENGDRSIGLRCARGEYPQRVSFSEDSSIIPRPSTD